MSIDVETTDYPHLPATRVIEFGAVEIISGQRSGRHYVAYVACDEPSVPGAFSKHQLPVEFLMREGRLRT